MDSKSYDALIIGGGPGGSAAATFLSLDRKRVLLLEKEHFPRFHIGESLLPYNHRIFREMGVLEALQEANFPAKKGAQFHLGDSSRTVQLIFRNGKFNREVETFQVERSKFDHLLLKHARQVGTDVREGWTATKFDRLKEGILLQAKDPAGNQHEFQGQFLIDASGRSNLTGNQEQLRVIHPNLKKLAVFGHFYGVTLDPEERAGDTIIVRLHNKWFWIIPISTEKVSVGCVMDQAEFVQSKLPPADLFTHIWTSSPAMRARMSEAKLAGPIQTTTDFSYYNRRLIGPRLLRVGDAAGFMDPIFSAGVYLAMYSGKLAARTILQATEQPQRESRVFRKYERQVFAAMNFYWELVENFYTTPFLELFFSPREKFQLVSALTAALAGEVEGGWRMRWRLRVFFWLVKLQRLIRFMPRITFEQNRPVQHEVD